MNILLLTGNGREHALATAYAKSKNVQKIIMIPGNGLTEQSSKKIKNYPTINPMDFEEIATICKKEHIDFVDISQDDLIANGYVDKFRELGIATFGPTKKASQIEWDKAWAREFMKKYNLPIPHFETFSETKKAISYITTMQEQTLFVKAAGLAGGKGVIKADTKDQAIAAVAAMKQFGASGKTFVIEQNVEGEEFSFFALCDGENYKIIGSAQDHKTVYNNNQGPNTGGMGCVSNPEVITPSISKDIEEKILKPFVKGMKNEGRPYTGIIYLGGMLTKNGPKVIEFNARWGDPEAQVLLPAIQTDYMKIVMAVQNKTLSNLDVKLDKKKRVSVAACALGYPSNYATNKNKPIYGISDMLKLKHISIYGAGILRKGNDYYVNGGRIVHVVGEGKNILQAREHAYNALAYLHVLGNNSHFRTDIGWQDVERQYKRNIAI